MKDGTDSALDESYSSSPLEDCILPLLPESIANKLYGKLNYRANILYI